MRCKLEPCAACSGHDSGGPSSWPASRAAVRGGAGFSWLTRVALAKRLLINRNFSRPQLKSKPQPLPWRPCHSTVPALFLLPPFSRPATLWHRSYFASCQALHHSQQPVSMLSFLFSSILAVAAVSGMLATNASCRDLCCRVRKRRVTMSLTGCYQVPWNLRLIIT